ncbi:MAG TPA: hypothetical protein VK851_08850 [Anaerolineales bacterium]|nr:hypothetical protein [Anaerolineales bacterium]
MIVEYIRENKGKSLLIAGIILMWALLGILFSSYGYEETWQLWGVPTHSPMFRDFQLIPGSAESFRNGFEPSIENPYDVGERIFNYPAFWRLFFYTNITPDDTVWIVALLLVLYFVSVVVFPQKLSVYGAILMLLVVFSPASMLLYERGNADLVVFSICVGIILAVGYSANLSAGLIALGAVVKMFPLLGVTVLLKEPRKRFWTLTAVCILFMAIYGIATFQSQSAAWNTTMRGDGISYGSFVLITRLGEYLQNSLPVSLSFAQLQIFFEVLALVLILSVGILAVREPGQLTASHERHLSAFRMGASIYVGTFLLGNNWDYRLAFLVLVIPQLTDWFRLQYKKRRLIVYAVLIAVLISCWHFLLKVDLPFLPLKDLAHRTFIFDEIVNWFLLPGFTYLVAASFPGWLKADLQMIFGAGKIKTHEDKDSTSNTP